MTIGTGIEERRMESSMSIQTRVSVVDVARLSEFYESKGIEIRSISGLIGMTVELCVELLGLPNSNMSVAKANNVLIDKGLYQKSLNLRSRRKIANAIALENLRNEGVDPSDYVPSHVNISKRGARKSLDMSKALEIFQGLQNKDGSKNDPSNNV